MAITIICLQSILTNIYVFLVKLTIFHFDLVNFISKNCKQEILEKILLNILLSDNCRPISCSCKYIALNSGPYDGFLFYVII